MNSMRSLLLLTFILYESQCAPSSDNESFWKALQRTIFYEEVYPVYKFEPGNGNIDWNQIRNLQKNGPFVIEIDNFDTVSNVNTEISSNVNTDINASENTDIEHNEEYFNNMNENWSTDEDSSVNQHVISNNKDRDGNNNLMKVIKNKITDKIKLAKYVIDTIKETIQQSTETPSSDYDYIEQITPDTVGILPSSTETPIKDPSYDAEVSKIPSTPEIPWVTEASTTTQATTTTEAPTTITTQETTTTEAPATTVVPTSTTVSPPSGKVSKCYIFYGHRIECFEDDAIATIPTGYQNSLPQRNIYYPPMPYQLWINNYLQTPYQQTYNQPGLQYIPNPIFEKPMIFENTRHNEPGLQNQNVNFGKTKEENYFNFGIFQPVYPKNLTYIHNLAVPNIPGYLNSPSLPNQHTTFPIHHPSSLNIQHPTFLSVQHPVFPVQHPETPVQRPVFPVQHPASPVQRPVLPVQHTESPVQHPVFPVQHPASSVHHPATPVQQPATSVQQPATLVQHPASLLQHPVFSVQYQASPVQHPATPVQHTESPILNTAFSVDQHPASPIQHPVFPIQRPEFPYNIVYPINSAFPINQKYLNNLVYPNNAVLDNQGNRPSFENSRPTYINIPVSYVSQTSGSGELPPGNNYRVDQKKRPSLENSTPINVNIPVSFYTSQKTEQEKLPSINVSFADSGIVNLTSEIPHAPLTLADDNVMSIKYQHDSTKTANNWNPYTEELLDEAQGSGFLFRGDIPFPFGENLGVKIPYGSEYMYPPKDRRQVGSDGNKEMFAQNNDVKTTNLVPKSTPDTGKPDTEKLAIKVEQPTTETPQSNVDNVNAGVVKKVLLESD